jgi:peptidoglycan/LPS O-acetylase OafA/YrhL
MERNKLEVKNLSKNIINFEFLNGFRGLMALIVVIAHINTVLGNSNPSDIFTLLSSMVNYLAMVGFFLLSAFLLTYRLLIDFSKNNYLNATLKYFIRRFFRIYLVYVVFCSLLKYGPNKIQYYFAGFRGSKESYPSWYELITITNTGSNHLWTIPIEIYYYFFIPFFCLTVDICYKFFHYISYKFFFLCFLILISLICIYTNILNLSDVELSKGFYVNIKTDMKLTFFVFFEGSMLAVVFLFIENNLSIYYKFLLNNRIIQNILNLFTILSWYYFYKNSPSFVHTSQSFDYLTKPGLELTLFLFLNLISNSDYNGIKYFFENSYILKNIGKYSFGIYLLHPIMILIFYENTNFQKSVTQIELNFIIFFGSYVMGILWFHLLENKLIKLANNLCTYSDRFFLKKNEILDV